MWYRTSDLEHFYKTPLGIRTRRILVQILQMQGFYTFKKEDKKGFFGYPWPFLRKEQKEDSLVLLSAARFSPFFSQEKRVNGEAKSIIVASETELPLQDHSLDYVFIIHWLEYAYDSQKALREIWRVLKNEGRVILVIPNRRSLWAAKDSTPFGQGISFSYSQILHLLRDSFFTPLNIQGALYMPPTSWRFLTFFFFSLERFSKKRVGRFLGFFAGVWVVEASKHTHAPLLDSALKTHFLSLKKNLSYEREALKE